MVSPDPPPLNPATHIRLATTHVHPDSGELSGIFEAAYALSCQDYLGADERDELRRTLRWFCRYLRSPRLEKPKAIFWFRSDAGRFVNRLWKVVDILRHHAIFVRMMLTSDPGSIVYRDRYQVAAVPMRRTHRVAAATSDILSL